MWKIFVFYDWSILFVAFFVLFVYCVARFLRFAVSTPMRVGWSVGFRACCMVF